jgi:hypothetical protein
MTSTASALLAPNPTQIDSIKSYLDGVSDDLLALLPSAEQLSSDGRRGIIARYSAVLEGNFIYWMTGAYIAAKSEEARAIIMENLHEEVRDSHPEMLRRFEIAANALPAEADVQAVYPNLSKVRLFIGKLSPAPIVTMMAFFEGFIQRFMPYLEELAEKQGSTEREYTQVHGVCDITHSQELFHALESEMALSPDSREPADYLYEGVHLLRALIETMFVEQSCAAA